MHVFIIDHADVGKEIAFAALHIHDNCVVICENNLQKKEVIRGNLEDVVMQIYKGFHEEIFELKESILIEILLEQTFLLEIKKAPIYVEKKINFNIKDSRHPP